MSSTKPKRSEIIKIRNQTLIIFAVKKRYLEVIPLSILEENQDTNFIIPRIQISYQSIDGYETLDSDIILWWIHSKNPLIKKVVENFLNEKQ